MKQTYQKPVINKHRSGLMNKFGWSPVYARKVRTEIDGVPIDRLVEQFGSPLFVYSERAARRKYRRMFNAFSTRYPNVVFGWSYKTNYLQAVYDYLVASVQLDKALGRSQTSASAT